MQILLSMFVEPSLRQLFTKHRQFVTILSVYSSFITYQIIGPRLRNNRTTEKWAYGRFNAKLVIYTN